MNREQKILKGVLIIRREGAKSISKEEQIKLANYLSDEDIDSWLDSLKYEKNKKD